MENRTTKTKIILYIILLAVLILPFMNYCFGFITSKSLSGWKQPEVKPEFSAKEVFSTDFQNQYEKYCNENVGFHNDLVRLRNQVHYSLFNISMNRYVVIGKQGYLYQDLNILDGVLGHDYVGQKVIDEKSEKIKQLQDTIKKEGKYFLVVLAPGKGCYYKEYIPDKYFKLKQNPTNYDEYVKAFTEKGVEFIDYKSYIMSLKDKVKYPLFTKVGIHWNKYCVTLVVDSLVKYFDKIYSDMPKFEVDYSVVDKNVWSDENDNYDNLNLIFHNKKQLLCHPKTEFISNGNNNRPTIITVADSYYWDVCWLRFGADYFQHSQYWYYNNDIYYSDSQEPRKTTDEGFSFDKEIKQADCYMMLFTEATLNGFDRGFVDSLYSYYFKNN
ncbi:MAG: hypothetical protein IJ759_07135 [Bacteroidales bacterium]|nr:hypothetical protein [Bacteroidales bacterium]